MRTIDKINNALEVLNNIYALGIELKYTSLEAELCYKKALVNWTYYFVRTYENREYRYRIVRKQGSFMQALGGSYDSLSAAIVSRAYNN